MRVWHKLAIVALCGLCGGCSYVLPGYVDVVSKSRACFGTRLYVDGRLNRTIDEDREAIKFGRGWHTVEAKKAGCASAKIGFWVENDECTESMLIKLYCSRGPGPRKLKLFMFGQQPRPAGEH